MRLLSQSREAFINNLRNTGLTYADAKIKFDNCLDEQEAELLQLHEQMLYAERMHQYALHRIALQHPRPSQTRPNPRWPVERPAAARLRGDNQGLKAPMKIAGSTRASFRLTFQCRCGPWRGPWRPPCPPPAARHLVPTFTSIADMWQNMLTMPWPWSRNTVLPLKK